MKSTRAEAKSSGDAQYFTGKPCKNGHLEPRITSNGTCLACARSHAKKHYSKYPEVIKRRASEYKKKNIEKIRAGKQRWRDKNRDYHRAYQRNYNKVRRESDPESVERRRKYTREWQREWTKKPEAKCIVMMRGMLGRMLSQRAGERTEEVLGYTTKDLRLHIESQFEDWMSWDNHGEWHVDHIIPIAQLVKDGVTDPSIVNALTNLRPLCAKQNMSLGAQYRHQGGGKV